jgi:hypothetical protein
MISTAGGGFPRVFNKTGFEEVEGLAWRSRKPNSNTKPPSHQATKELHRGHRGTEATEDEMNTGRKRLGRFRKDDAGCAYFDFWQYRERKRAVECEARKHQDGILGVRGFVAGIRYEKGH